LVSSLVTVLGSAAGDNLKATAASTLARLLRASPALMGSLVDKYGIGVMLAGARGRGAPAWETAVGGHAAARPRSDRAAAAAAAAVWRLAALPAATLFPAPPEPLACAEPSWRLPAGPSPGLSDTSSKVQISAANMLNQLLSAPELVARAR
jgi:serine/threonine-protein kinase ULK4